MKKILILLISVIFLSIAGVVLAQSESGFVADEQITVKAQVLEIKKQEKMKALESDLEHIIQTLKVKILEGDNKGDELTLENDHQVLKDGEIFYLKQISDSVTHKSQYSIDEPYRLPQVSWLIGIFLLAVLIFGGIQGVRGVVSLVGSFLLILYVLIPGILYGISPLLVAVGVSSLIIVVGSYITHGFNKMTSSAVIGMLITISFTGLLALWSVYFTRLSGFGSEEVVYLNMSIPGGIDVLGLLLGGIMIGLLGVLYDVAIGQATAVEELLKLAPPGVPKTRIYKRALRIGREHIGALVNTLAIAYVGVSLPLMLLFSQISTDSILVTLNREIFSAEIVRIVIGSIGLILAVPITTFVSVWMLGKDKS
jgi:uncharacterized membrane protein